MIKMRRKKNKVMWNKLKPIKAQRLNNLENMGKMKKEKRRLSKGKTSPKSIWLWNPHIKKKKIIQDSNEEGKNMKTQQEALGDNKIEIEEEGHKSPKGESQIPERLEKQLEKKTPTLRDEKARIEAILDQAQISTKKEKS